MSISLKTTVLVNQEIEINLETPAFYKNPTTFYGEYIGVLDECTIEILLLNGITTIRNCATEERIREIKNALDKWEHISEEEFFESLDKALKDFNFKPSLITKPLFTLTHEEQEERDRQEQEERVNDYFERELDID